MRIEQIGDCTLYNGDCMEIMPSIPSRSVDLILCDLPYGTTQNKWDSVLPLDQLWAEYWRIVKPNGAVVLTAQTPFDKVLGMSCLKHLKYEWLWVKSRATGHLNCWKQPMKNHENVLVFYRKQCTYNPQDIVKKTTPKVRKGGSNGTNYGKSDKDSLQEWEDFPRSVLKIKSQGKTFHSTQKPVELMEYLIRTYTNEGELVLDNTMGSGTTGEAARNTNRHFIGIDQSPAFFDFALRRISGPLTVTPHPPANDNFPLDLFTTGEAA